jgi:phosphoribosylformylglycinamidine synthase
MALGGRLGATVDLQGVNDALATTSLLFSESNGRLLIEVAPEDAAAFEFALAGVQCIQVGAVASNPTLQISRGDEPILSLPVYALVSAWKGETEQGEPA